jgi:lysophospholipase L1-like esterase
MSRPEHPTPNARRRLRRLAGVVVIIAASAVGAELVIRVYVWLRGWTPNCYAASLELFRPHPELGYDLRPGFRLRSGVYTIAINSLGLRGPEITAAKSAGVRRIAILGGSAAFGYLVSDGEESARLLEHRLRRTGHRVDVINAGVPGYNLLQTVPRFRQLIARLSPDVVVLYLGWNDLGYVVSDTPEAARFRRRPIAPTWERAAGKSTLYGFLRYRLFSGPLGPAPARLDAWAPTPLGAAQFVENLRTLGDTIRASGAKMTVCAPASAANPAADPTLKAALAETPANVEKVVALGAWLHETLAEFARTQDAPFIDAYRQIPPTPEFLFDYIHLTRAGEERLAELLADELAELLAD